MRSVLRIFCKEINGVYFHRVELRTCIKARNDATTQRRGKNDANMIASKRDTYSAMLNQAFDQTPIYQFAVIT